ncbi:hypothetical protein M569_01502 [Genlisea aurea]|uniref:UDP-N-acetylglucosamine--peptide N-acetylglucosaminyltransferase SPINDLY n=1 Tax=Genlisea aurea TaxID=192259 RepID=S8EBD7_9LAMI|nr:hypothetical protein M569_01502 [Genlisea aurea]
MSRAQNPAYSMSSLADDATVDALLTPNQTPQRPIVVADLNVDPPDVEAFAFSSSSSVPASRIIVDETSVEKGSGKDSDIMDVDASQPKKVGKCRLKSNKTEYPPECGGADADADHYGQGMASIREEKVSSLKTGLVHVARKMPKNMHAHFILGLMYQRMGQPQKAILAYEKASEILLRSGEEIDRPELLAVVQLHHAQCILLESLENCSTDRELEPHELHEICSKMKESLESDLRQAAVWNILGLMLLRTGRLQSAIFVFSSLLEVAPDNLDGIGNLGIAYLREGCVELSEKCFQKLVLKDQNHPAALINFAALLLYRYGLVVAGPGASSDAQVCPDLVAAVNVAKDCLLAAAKSDPRSSHIWTNLANAYFLIGDHKISGKCLEKAGRLNPNCLATRYAVGIHRVRDAERSQNPNEQLTWAGNEMASVLREGDPIIIEPHIAWGGLSLVHKAQHEISSAFEISRKELLEVKEHAMYSLKQAVGEDPDDAVHWHQLGLHCLCTQQFKTSMAYHKAAVARLNKSVYTWSNLGISLQLLGQTSQAEEVYKHALSLATSEQAHSIFNNLGNFYRQLEEYDRAKAMFSKALELQPGYAPAYNNLGLVFVAEGLLEQGQFCFNKAFELDPLLDAAKSNIIKATARNKRS